jgi:hypothetical protein
MLNGMTLSRLPMQLKVLFTSYIIAVGFGLMMAGGQIMMTHGMADGEVGLSLDDVVYSYYGNKTGSKLESKLNGSMQAMAPNEVRLDMIKWAREGAPEAEWEPKFKAAFTQYCVLCHNAAQTSLPAYETYEGVKKVTEVDEGASFSALTRVSHIHLFGIGFIFFFVGLIFSFARFSLFWKCVLIATPFAFLIVDILSWWLTKIDPIFAWLTIIGGFGYSLAATIMLFTSLAQMWVPMFQDKEAA